MIAPYQEIVVADQGPVYTETNLSHFIVEPLNTITAIIFIGIAIYWLTKVGGNFKRYAFMMVITVLLLIGGVGGTLYHAFRSSWYYMMMDYLPILIIGFFGAMYLMYKLFHSWKIPLLIGVGVSVIEYFVNNHIADPLSTNLSYLTMAIFVILPLFAFLRRTHFYQVKMVLFGLASFCCAIGMRFLDPNPERYFEPVGLHFLWHTFGAFACFFLFRYFYKINDVDLIPGKKWEKWKRISAKYKKQQLVK
ncbi:hypothetical protein [Persicobacter psychrovividus]|uniref:hypothetical protein n=1 Tax=Persicobacter psychrovividus TaxID=387638 RepID=UPI002FCDFE7D